MSKSAHPDDTSWTTSPDRAVRFAYREDAASYIECVFAPAVQMRCMPTEHIWTDGAKPRP